MDILISVFKLLAGIGLFLFAMYLIEESLKNLSGRNFKLFLKRATKHSLTAVAGGAIITGILQSSSMVSLMVLAFVSAEIFALREALAIILGANLGTTLDSWIVATLGFKINIEMIAYPILFVGGFLIVLFNKYKRIKFIAYFAIGFSLLFIGLAFMKTSMEQQVSMIDLSIFKTMPQIIFLIVGFFITLLVQSSSVTMALTLSALHVGAIGFLPAVLLVLGSETGTTIKLILSAIGGNSIKKQIVLGNFIFNITLTILAYIFIQPLIYFITKVLQINDPLIGLVSFSSLVNLASVLIFVPILKPFTLLLQKFFKRSKQFTSSFIENVPVSDTPLATKNLMQECEYFIYNTMQFNLGLLSNNTFSLPPFIHAQITEKEEHRKTNTLQENHLYLQQVQGEIQSFYIKLKEHIDEGDIAKLNQLMSSVRSAMHSVEDILNMESEITDLYHSSKDIKFQFLQYHQKASISLYTSLNKCMNLIEHNPNENLKGLYENILQHFSESLENFYNHDEQLTLNDLDRTTIINFNRELFSSNKAMLISVKDFLLAPTEADKFNQILIYRT